MAILSGNLAFVKNEFPMPFPMPFPFYSPNAYHVESSTFVAAFRISYSKTRCLLTLDDGRLHGQWDSAPQLPGVWRG